MSESVAWAARLLIATAVVLSCVLFTPSLADPVNVIKLTVVVMAALLLLLLAVFRVVRPREALVPSGAIAWTAVALAVALLVAALVAPSRTIAVVGTAGRNSGLLAYAAGIVVLLVGLRVWTASTAQTLLIALMTAGLFTATYGLLQYAGVDPINWNNPFNPIIASLGNPDFASAYLGMATPAAVWGVTWRRWGAPGRVVSGLLAAGFLVTAFLSEAIQGPLAAAAGLSVVLVAWLMNRGGPSSRWLITAFGAVLGVGVIAGIAGLGSVGPAAHVFESGSFQARKWYWQAAMSMFRDHPLAGVGLDQYGSYYRQVRPDAATTRLGGGEFSDAAHSVPLQMLSQGGILLAGAYLAFTVAVAVALIVGLRRSEGPNRLLLSAVGGCWVAYVVQSLVSIDQVPLLVVQFACAGAVGGLVGGQLRVRRLPGALPEAPTGKGRRTGRVVVRERSLSTADAALIGAAGVLVLVGLWFSLLPLRASAATHAGDNALNQGNGTVALDAYAKAAHRLPGVGESWRKLGSLYETARQPDQALTAYYAGLEHEKRNVLLLLSAARLEKDKNDLDAAGALYRRAVHLDPTNPDTVLPATQVLMIGGNAAEADRLLTRVLRVLPATAAAWAADGSAKAALKDEAGARAAFQRALELEPGNEVATKGLAALGGS